MALHSSFPSQQIQTGLKELEEEKEPLSLKSSPGHFPLDSNEDYEHVDLQGKFPNEYLLRYVRNV